MQASRQFVLVLALAVLVTVAGCVGGDTGSEPTETGTPTATPTATPEATTAESAGTYALGETVALDQDDTTLAVRVLDYRLVDSYDAGDGSGGTHTVAAPAGQQFLFVKVTVENTGGEDGATASVVVRPRNESFSRDDALPTWASEDWYRNTRPLPAGETRTGWLLVQTDAAVAASDVRVAFSPDILVTDDEFEWTLEDGET